MRFVLFLLLLGLNYILYPQKILINSIPKAGTNLAEKCIKKLTGIKTTYFEYEIPSSNKLATWGNNYILKSHSKYTQSRYKLIQANKMKTFLVIRDPRDQIISWIYWAYPEFKNTKRPNYQAYNKLSFNELVTELICDGSEIYGTLNPSLNDKSKSKNIKTFYDSFLNWLKHKDICLIKFENLIGPLGGGNYNTQIKEIQKIAKHLDFNMTIEEIKKIANDLFGNTATFREGKIGAWKDPKHFNEYNKNVFKNIAGDLLIKLGYETNLDW